MIKTGAIGVFLVAGSLPLLGCQSTSPDGCCGGEWPDQPGDTAVFRGLLERSSLRPGDLLPGVVRVPAGYRKFLGIEEWVRGDTLFLKPKLTRGTNWDLTLVQGSRDTSIRFSLQSEGSKPYRWVRYWVLTDSDKDSMVVQEIEVGSGVLNSFSSGYSAMGRRE